jgi:hypothetical protein
MTRDVSKATLIRTSRVLLEAAIASLYLVPNITRSQRPHVDAARGYMHEASVLLDAAQAAPRDGGPLS